MSDITSVIKRTPSAETTEAVRAKYEEVVAAHKTAVEKAVELGNMLIRVKDESPHGSFQSYIDNNFDFSHRTAQRFMKLAAEVPKLKEAEATRVSHLSLNEAMRVIGSTTASATELDTKTRRKVLNTAKKDKLSIGEAERLVEKRARKPKPPAEATESVQPPTYKRMPRFQPAKDVVVYVGIDTDDTDAAAGLLLERLEHDVFIKLRDSMTKVLEADSPDDDYEVVDTEGGEA